ncbi:MAG: putative toxin-antitoxin system toxin component, PIN family [Elusimicrobiota bacterium]
MRIVLDVNVVVSGIFWSGPPHAILRRWLQGKVTLLVSEPILAEYREVTLRMTGNSGAAIFTKWNRIFTELSEIVEPRRRAGICRDPDDDKYLEAAVGGGAQALVSGDKDLLVLKNIDGIPILSPRAFLQFTGPAEKR